jgi:hypothetical protein
LIALRLAATPSLDDIGTPAMHPNQLEGGIASRETGIINERRFEEKFTNPLIFSGIVKKFQKYQIKPYHYKFQT